MTPSEDRTRPEQIALELPRSGGLPWKRGRSTAVPGLDPDRRCRGAGCGGLAGALATVRARLHVEPPAPGGCAVEPGKAQVRGVPPQARPPPRGGEPTPAFPLAP